MKVSKWIVIFLSVIAWSSASFAQTGSGVSYSSYPRSIAQRVGQGVTHYSSYPRSVVSSIASRVSQVSVVSYPRSIAQQFARNVVGYSSYPRSLINRLASTAVAYASYPRSFVSWLTIRSAGQDSHIPRQAESNRRDSGISDSSGLHSLGRNSTASSAQ